MPIGLLITFLIFIRDLFAVIMWPNEYSMKPRDSKGMEEESVVNMPIKLEQMIWPFFSLSHLWFYINNSETITTLDFLPHKFWFNRQTLWLNNLILWTFLCMVHMVIEKVKKRQSIAEPQCPNLTDAPMNDKNETENWASVMELLI